jgi:zinc protease
MRNPVRLLLLLCFAAAALAQPTLVDIPFQKFVLPNGLTVIVHEDHKAPIVAVNLWYHVGSKNEKFGKTGFAHLYEHLMFGGSENNKGSYIQGMEKIGATNLNGTTNQDRTNYFENVPTPALDYVLFAESDRMGHFINAFDKKTLDQQRGVVQNEKRQGENQPYGMVDSIIQQNTYPASHPYSWSVIGSMDDLNAASLDDVKEWFRSNYGPSNTVLVLAGDIDVKTAREKVTRYFGDIPSGPPVAHQEQWVAKMTGVHRMKMRDRVPQARLLKVWNIPGIGTEAGDFLDLASDSLARGRNSRLYKRLVYDEQLCTAISAGLDSREIGGQFIIDATAVPGKGLGQIEKIIDEELARFLREGPTAAELQRVQTQYTADFIRGLDRVGGFGGKSDLLAQSEVFTGDPAYAFRTSLKRHQDATREQVRKAAVDWLSDGTFVLQVLPFPDYVNETSKVDRSKPPVIGDEPQLRLPKLQRATLSNGLKVVLAERHEIPVIDMAMVVNAGFAADQSASPGTATLTSSMLTFGTRTRSALQIAEQIDSLGSQLGATSNIDLSTVSLNVLKRNLDPSLDLFADVIVNANFPPADFARERQQQIAAIQQEKADPVSVTVRVIAPLLYGPGHAYGVPFFSGSGTEESLGKMTAADLVKFHAAWYKPNNSTLSRRGSRAPCQRRRLALRRRLRSLACT